MICRKSLVALFIAVTCISGKMAVADNVKVDLLGGVGDFDYSGDTRWYSGYTGSDYNFDTQSGYTTASSGGWHSGYDPATADNSVAVGWYRRTGPSVHPRDNVTYRIDASGISGSNCQFFFLKRVVGDSVYAMLESDLKVGTTSSDVHTGDTVALHIDSVRMSGYSSLPAGTTVQYTIGFEGGGEKTLVASATTFSDEISMQVIRPAGQWVTPYVKITVSGPLGAAQPGVYVDGAHLFVKRASDPSKYATWEVPVVANKGVKTLFYRPDWRSAGYDLYAVAKNCDSAIVDESDGAFVAKLKYLNPNIKTYLGLIYTCVDARDSRGIDLWYYASPTQMGWVIKNNHTDWLYSGGNGVYGFVNEPDFPYSYYMRVTNSAYQSYWVATAKAKALRWKHQGVFMDSINPLTQQKSASKITVPQRDPYEVQKFLHATVPTLRSASLDVVANVGGNIMSVAPSNVFLNSRWTPTPPYNTSNYTSNLPSNTPNIVFQEWGFIRYSALGNNYDSPYWLKCLQDMDAVKSWNTLANGTLVPLNERIYYSVQVPGVDKTSDPAGGINGWLQFGLASYLLGQNDWTYFSWYQRAQPTAAMDYSATSNFGAPDGDRASISGDPYFLCRKYTTTDGGHAVVVVNANVASSRGYTLESDAVDELGTNIIKGTTVTLKPHTGRIFVDRVRGITIDVGSPTPNVSPGQSVAIVVNYTNSSTTDASAVLITAKVPDQVTYVAGSAEATGGVYSAATNSVSWQIPFLRAGSGGTKRFNVTVK